MTTNRPLTLRLEPHADSQLIAGWVVDERGYQHYFSSWLGLLTLLAHARLVAAEGARRARVKRELDVVKLATSKETPMDHTTTIKERRLTPGTVDPPRD